MVALRAGVLRRADDFAAFAFFALAAGLRFIAVVAMISPRLTQANHLQMERITVDSTAQGGCRMADDELIDEIAKAMARATNGGDLHDDRWYSDDHRELWWKRAAAALDVMRSAGVR